MADKMLVYIQSTTTAYAAWKTLKDMLEPQGALGIVMVCWKLFRSQCEEGADIEEHIRTLQGYREELSSLGATIQNNEFSITLLTSLLETWNTFIGSIDTKKLDDTAKIIA
jgi:hypothetical protein